MFWPPPYVRTLQYIPICYPSYMSWKNYSKITFFTTTSFMDDLQVKWNWTLQPAAISDIWNELKARLGTGSINVRQLQPSQGCFDSCCCCYFRQLGELAGTNSAAQLDRFCRTYHRQQIYYHALHITSHKTTWIRNTKIDFPMDKPPYFVLFFT